MTQTLAKDMEFDLALNIARQSLYRFGALALSDPRVGSWEKIHDKRSQELVLEAAALLRSTPGARAMDLSCGELPLEELDPGRVFALLSDSETDLNMAYERTFGLVVSGACPPYETEYLNSKFTFQRSQQLADISGFYRAFGLRPSSQHPERYDHIVLELEFMAFLLGLERQAIESDQQEREEHIAVCRDAQAKFVEEHLAWWIPTFAKLLSMEDPQGCYGALAIFLSALIPVERALLAITAPPGAVSPSSVEPPEECEGCLLQQGLIQCLDQPNDENIKALPETHKSLIQDYYLG